MLLYYVHLISCIILLSFYVICSPLDFGKRDYPYYTTLTETVLIEKWTTYAIASPTGSGKVVEGNMHVAQSLNYIDDESFSSQGILVTSTSNYKSPNSDRTSIGSEATYNVHSSNPKNTSDSSDVNYPYQGLSVTTASSSELFAAISSPSISDRYSTIEGPSVQTSTAGSFDLTIRKVWNRFYKETAWCNSDLSCGSSCSSPVVWNEAVVGRAVALSGNLSGIQRTIQNIYAYRNTDLNVFSASTAGDDDIYNDDNAQIVWVFTDAYEKTGSQDYLQSAIDIVEFLQGQWNEDGGGVIWKYQNDYIASISTLEAALAAMRLYEITKNNTLAIFASNCLNFTFEYLQDPNDKLIYDGLSKSDYTNVNKGKLTYSVGTALSVMSLLDKYDIGSWGNKIIELGSAAMNKKGAFFNSNGYWNNMMQYVHLLFAGYYDVLTSAKQQPIFEEYRAELVNQYEYIKDYLQDPQDINLYFDSATSGTEVVYSRYANVFGKSSYTQDDSIFCNDDASQLATKSLMVNGAVSQILHFVENL